MSQSVRSSEYFLAVRWWCADAAVVAADGIFTSDIRQQMLSCHEVLPWLEHHQTETDSRVKRWIDVWGYNPNLIAQLAQEFDIHPGAFSRLMPLSTMY